MPTRIDKTVFHIDIGNNGPLCRAMRKDALLTTDPGPAGENEWVCQRCQAKLVRMIKKVIDANTMHQLIGAQSALRKEFD